MRVRDARTKGLTAAGADRFAALTGGYHAAFLVAAVAAALGALLFQRPNKSQP
jgi:biotin transporter BioY